MMTICSSCRGIVTGPSTCINDEHTSSVAGAQVTRMDTGMLARLLPGIYVHINVKILFIGKFVFIKNQMYIAGIEVANFFCLSSNETEQVGNEIKYQSRWDQ